MSLGITLAVAGVYAGGMLGLHRFGVWRRRQVSGGFPALARLDWSFLLSGVPETLRPPIQASVLAGQPVPTELTAALSEALRAHVDLLSKVTTRPRQVLESLFSAPAGNPERLVLREHLRIARASRVTLEWEVFPAKAALRAGLQRYGDVPALYFTRAYASAQLGFNASAIDDLARAVYFSGRAPFYLQAVLDSPFIARERPALYRECESLAAARDSGMGAPR